MNPVIGWGLAVAAIAAGYMSYGWPGVALGVSAVVFWLLLQFTRILKVLRIAGNNPVGLVPNAVMFNVQLRKGIGLTDVLKKTRSLGRRIGEGENPEVFAWADASGDEVQVQLVKGRVTAWTLVRAAGQSG